jgi:hypothetical protein
MGQLRVYVFYNKPEIKTTFFIYLSQKEGFRNLCRVIRIDSTQFFFNFNMVFV